MPIALLDAISNFRENSHTTWHSAKSSKLVSTNPADASFRVYGGMANIRADYPGPKLKKDAGVFTMGSCFAREIEGALLAMGGNVTSVDRRLITNRYFADGNGIYRDGFFHRFTPRAMLHEFKAAFGEFPGWDQSKSLILQAGKGVHDLNYWPIIDTDNTLEATVFRRQTAHDLVRRAAKADVIVLTLGLTESWRQVSTGYDLNRFSPHLKKTPHDYTFDVLDYENVMACLEEIHALLHRHHETGNFQLVVTVSPVPLGSTFTKQDIVVANQTSKSTLRAAAGSFCQGKLGVNYFPSYEIVLHSRQAEAWRPDKLHVRHELVRHIVRNFITTYFEAGSFDTDSRVAARAAEDD